MSKSANALTGVVLSMRSLGAPGGALAAEMVTRSCWTQGNGKGMYVQVRKGAYRGHTEIGKVCGVRRGMRDMVWKGGYR